jgi:tartrate dehydrogenase/decarboxylase / D-malate dehydrogenase
MLDHLGHTEAAADMIRAIENLLKGDGPKTPDMGGKASTEEMCRALEEELGN